jgi:hypothetical protein
MLINWMFRLKVDIEVGKLYQIKNERDIEGTKVVSSQSDSELTLLSEVLPTNLHPTRINIIVSHPYCMCTLKYFVNYCNLLIARSCSCSQCVERST